MREGQRARSADARPFGGYHQTWIGQSDVELTRVGPGTPPDECQTLVQRVPQKARVTMKVYPKASHGFDVKRAEADAPVRGRLARLGGYHRGAAAAAWQAIASFLQQVR